MSSEEAGPLQSGMQAAERFEATASFDTQIDVTSLLDPSGTTSPFPNDIPLLPGQIGAAESRHHVADNLDPVGELRAFRPQELETRFQ